MQSTPRSILLAGLCLAVLVALSGCGGGSSGSNIPAADTGPPAGSLDEDFGASGVVFYDGGDGNDAGLGVRCDNDGRIIVVGSSFNSSGDYDIALWRYDQEGSLDSGFGNAGLTVYDSGQGNDEAMSLALDDDGRILVVGYSATAADGLDVTLLRYNTDGSLDSGFGNGGCVILDGGAGKTDVGWAVRVDDAGRILLLGYIETAGGSDVRIWRLNTDGSPDTSFNNGQGFCDYDSGTDDFPRALALDAGGRILVAGYYRDAGSTNIFVLAYSPDGSLDQDFGNNGVFVYDNGIGYAKSFALALDSQARVVLAGCLTGDGDDMAVMRLGSDGSLDGGFNGGMPVTVDWIQKHDYGLWVVVDSQDRPVVVGRVQKASDETDLCMWRFNPDGSPDTGFGQDGHVRWDGGYGDDQGRSVAIDADGRLVVTGVTWNQDGNNDMFLGRFAP